MDNRVVGLSLVAALLFAGFGLGAASDTIPVGNIVQSMDGPISRESVRDVLFWPSVILVVAASSVLIALAVSRRGKIKL